MDGRLKYRLEEVARRYRRLVLLHRLTLAWIVVAALGIGLLLVQGSTGWWSPAVAVALPALAFVAAILCVATSLRGPDGPAVARKIESTFPELDTRLLVAVEQTRNSAKGVGFLQELVVRQAVEHGRSHAWTDAVPSRTLLRSHFIHLTSLVALGFVLVNVFQVDRGAPGGSTWEARRLASEALDVSVEPGDTEIERGTDLLILARFKGAMPASVRVGYGSASEDQNVELSKSLDDPLFGGRIPSITGDIVYRVHYDESQTDAFRVKVFDYPALMQADAKLDYPEYAGLEQKLLEDVRRVSAVEGTNLTLLCRLNKQVAAAELVAEDGSPIALTAQPDGQAIYSATLRMTKSGKYKLKLVDEQGRPNKADADFEFTVLPNRPVELKFAYPGRDEKVSPIEELAVGGTAWDDFGLTSYGVTYTYGEAEPTSIVLGNAVRTKEAQKLDYLIPFENLKAKPDELVSYYLWAEDVDAAGRPRKSFSDMYFAEVRHFDELFRQGQQPPGGAQQQMQAGSQGQGAQLAEVQKQIIIATWKLLRQAVSDETFNKDVGVLRDSQADALQQLESLADRAQDAESGEKVEQVKKHMERALEHLRSAAEQSNSESLRQALPPEQAAFQALLKLTSARENQVSRGQGGGGGGGGGRSQQQLNQLQLDNTQNRYENRSVAKEAQSAQQREQNQVLSRLRELAQRQADLNQRLQELQTALQEAKTEEEKEEIRRRLKRLREEQQQILRDSDELRDRMNQPENQQRMAEAREQLQETRERVRQASEALEQGMVPKALAEGSRAERQLQQLRDDFRKKSANAFTEQVQELRTEARELAQKQKELDKPAKEGEQHRLRDTKERRNIAEGLEQQRGRLKELLENMKQTTEQAEQSEPLLSKQLYDAFRKAHHDKADESLAMSAELHRRGFAPQGQEVQEKASVAINDLKRGVEKAAESVLGDPVESIRRARDQVQELTDQLGRELAQADPREQEPTPKGRRAQGNAKSSKSAARAGDKAKQASNSEPKSGDQSSEAGEEQAGESGAQGTEGQENQAKASTSGSAKSSGSGGATRKSGQSKDAQAQGGQGGQSGSSGDSQREPKQGGGRQPGLRNGGQEQRSDQPSGGRSGSFVDAMRQGGASGPGGNHVFNGEEFREWSDRLRDVEEMLEDPLARADTTRIREEARSLRAEFKRHSKEPEWELVRTKVFLPLIELQARLDEELRAKTNEDSLAPIDRDPVPRKYAKLVREYYERLGTGQ